MVFCPTPLLFIILFLSFVLIFSLLFSRLSDVGDLVISTFTKLHVQSALGQVLKAEKAAENLHSLSCIIYITDHLKHPLLALIQEGDIHCL